MAHPRLSTAAALAALAVLAAACGNSSSTTSPTTTTSVPRSTTSTTGAPTTTTPSTTSSTTTKVADCTFSQLSVSAGQAAAGVGHVGVPLVLRNVGASTCTLTGYPGVAALDAQGNQAAQAQRTPGGYLGGLPAGTTVPIVVTLAPGQAASAMVEGTDVPTGTATSCPQYPALLVTPPNTTQSVRVTAALPGCSPIEVHPVVPGVTGSPE